MTKKVVLCLFSVSLLLIATDINSEGLRIIMVGKSKNDANHIKAYKGACKEAKKNNDHIVTAGSDGDAHFRTQNASLSKLLEDPTDGIIIAVTHEDYLLDNTVKIAEDKKIPVMTYDSDFTEPHKSHRITYIGIDNEEYGYTLGMAARRFSPKGGVVSIIGDDRGVPNITQRINGIRRALNNNNPTPRLDGTYGWIEYSRSPWYCHDNDDQALDQVLASLKDQQVNVIISTGGWSQHSLRYRDTIMPFRSRFKSREKVFICGGATEVQRQHNQNGLCNYNLDINFEEMGRQAYLTMKAHLKGKKVPEYIYVPTRGISPLSRDN